MAQKLILPINKCMVTASYKTVAYKARFGFMHYGADIISTAGQKTVYASGSGTVLMTGLDNVLGNAIVVSYNDVINHKTGRRQNVIARYYHLDSILVEPNSVVTSNTKLGIYGNTGKYSAGAHLHIEFDANTAVPRSSKTLGGNSNIIWAAQSDNSIDPFHILHVKASLPDNQQICVSDSRYNGYMYALPECAGIPAI